METTEYKRLIIKGVGYYIYIIINRLRYKDKEKNAC